MQSFRNTKHCASFLPGNSPASPIGLRNSRVTYLQNIQYDQPVCGLEDRHSNSAENFDSVLIDQSISSLSSTADFHYYASTHKWPANTRETGTNTVDLSVLQPKSTTVLNGDDVEHRLLFNADDSARCLYSPLTVPVAQKYFASKLAEMDVQLTTLQNISENMELEFYNTRLFVDTAEKLNKQQHYVNQKCLGTGILAKKKGLMRFNCLILSENLIPIRLTKDSLQPQKLRYIYNILNDLETDSMFPASELDLPQKQTRQVKRICHLYQGFSKSRHQREEIREWMKRKYKQRQAEYRRQLDEKRKKEHHPFTPTANVSSEDIKINNIIKGVKDKMVSAEHHSHRKMEAVKLMKEIVSDAMQLTACRQNPVTTRSRRFVQSPKRRAARR
ncbi:ciliogenesis and planar polarity effector 1-like [Erpetoichthys calabaricus]|uniref:ciliogenesis and planar polarity effector 1-like n=1 Tax=Erpetoichthys calabaricus TaxID=27687 RepID=UPI00223485D6|nr:ciliogenesis and planar polarity effector 1-like [Erpetoichthys calabaricus]